MGKQVLGLVLASAIASLIASCSSGIDAGTTLPAGDLQGEQSNLVEGDATDNTFSGIPSIPWDSGEGRAVSEAGAGGSVSVLGKDYLQMAGGVVEGDALILTGGVSDSGGERRFPAFGLYKVGGLGNGKPLSLNVECLTAAPDQGYFIGIANYSHASWKWFGPVNLPEFQLDLRGRNERFVTQLGNLYFIIVCPAGVSATHFKSTITYGDGQSLPGTPHHLQASKGKFDHAVALNWEPGAGAVSYQLAKRPLLPGSQWMPLGETAETNFMDNRARNFQLFEYRVRGINAEGESCYGAHGIGWAGPEGSAVSISGQVLDSAGGSMAGAKVDVVGYGPALDRRTGEDGTYEFKALPPGVYVLTCRKPGFSFEPSIVRLELAPGEVATQNFTGGETDPLVVVGGFVAALYADAPGNPIGPLAGATVGIKLADGSGEVLTTTTDEFGHYAFHGLAPGEYILKAHAEGFQMVPREHRVRLGERNMHERRDFIGMPPPPGGSSDPGSGGDPGGGGDPSGGGSPPDGGGGLPPAP